ncbi:glycolate oxidase iron-sulfur subunit [Salsuginibacillus halophilus]|uniref:Glycolate oxidase iron-sulfur subunit n=1 Tax=Salsuginibacillus halophilus TaxID=517424 RepID=A0A2P8HQG7_9BACI|nr:(Fe-S)-binding protein [Salsuginibacillus halophilus]PSL48457.1 glycolate oxidase iron-sulfur subunit [Salsuginibacillus halophilus]
MTHTTGAERLYEMSYDATNQCIQCGYCLPACPTYFSMGSETHSPRGRINLVKMAAEGKIDLQSDLQEPIDFCLGCRACETACPVDVPYGEILEAAKETLAEEVPPVNKRAAAFKSFMLRKVFTRPGLMRAGGSMTWLYQKTGMGKAARKLKLIHKVSEPLGNLEAVMPPVERPGRRPSRGTVLAPYIEKQATVAFFTGCISDAVMNRTNRLTVELLRHVGCEVVIPKQQNCCGALHSHQGDAKTSKSLAQENIAAFEATGADYYVNNAGGCGASLKEYPHILAGDPAWKERAKHFSASSKDISELLVLFGPLPFTKEGPAVVTYQPSCHLRNVQLISEAPRELLRSIPGSTYIEMENSEDCCASGGIYNILHHEEANKILDEKMKYAEKTEAKVMTASNPGCLLQMRLGIQRAGLEDEMEGKHLIDVLAEACGIE